MNRRRDPAGAEINVTLRASPASSRSTKADRDTTADCKRGGVSLVYNRSSGIKDDIRLGMGCILHD